MLEPYKIIITLYNCQMITYFYSKRFRSPYSKIEFFKWSKLYFYLTNFFKEPSSSKQRCERWPCIYCVHARTEGKIIVRETSGGEKGFRHCAVGFEGNAVCIGSSSWCKMIETRWRHFREEILSQSRANGYWICRRTYREITASGRGENG